MSFTRAQVNAAKEALGLDPRLTATITIMPTQVHTSIIDLIDGQPDIKDGQVGMVNEMHDIEEAPNVDA